MCDRVLLHEKCIALQLERESPPALQRGRPPLPPNNRPQHVTYCATSPSSLLLNPPPPSSLPPKPQQQQPPPRRSSKFLQFQYGSLNRHHVNKDPQPLAAHALSKSTDGLNSDLVEGGVQVATKTTAVQTFKKLISSNVSAGNNGILQSLNTPSSTVLDSTRKVASPPFGNSSSTSSGTPTPTNPVIPHPLCPTSPNRNVSQGPLNNYHEGLLLFQSWVAANAACVWDNELVRAAKASHFVGVLVGGFLLIGGTPRVLAAICHAHSRALLTSPPGWNIILLGEIRDCEVSVVTRGHFTPLGDALCWVIHRLTNMGIAAEQDSLRNALLSQFPSMTPPDPALVHATLSDLIRQRKVFHTARGYGIVQPDTYVPVPAPSLPEEKPAPPRLLTTSEALTRAHGTEEMESDGLVCHAAVQTDLADLLSGIWPDSTILVPRSQNATHCDLLLQRSGSFRNGHRRVALLSPDEDSIGKPKIRQYEGFDLSDVTHRGGDKASMLSKLLRVSQPRRRLASFSAQFPPPEWSAASMPVKHLHSVATQTRSSKHPGGPESCMMRNVFWAPRSSTLPRRPPKPLSTSPVPRNSIPYRPHSASPSHPKMTQDVSYSVTQYSPHRQVQQFSSPAPSLTPTQSSRNPSPSLQSSSAGPDNALAQRYYHKSTSPNHNLKRDSPTPQYTHSRAHSASPSKVPSHKLNQHASLYSSLARDPRRKPLSLPNQCKAPEGNSVPTEKDSDVILRNAEHRRSPNRIQGRQNTPHRHTHSTTNVVDSNQRRKPPQQRQDEEPEYKKEQDPKRGNVRRYKNDRSSLQLDLSTVHMNNSRVVVSSPTKPEGLKKVFQENLSSNIAKGSISDLTSKNLGYTDVDKCDKKLCIIGSSMIELDSDKISKDEDEQSTNVKLLSKSSPSLEEKSLKGFGPLKLGFSIAPDRLLDETEDLKNGLEYEKPISPNEEIYSVKTYPSLSELNLNFSSLTAQKILQGVSVNSIDTLVEVNMLADKSLNEDVTNTNFGFV